MSVLFQAALDRPVVDPDSPCGGHDSGLYRRPTTPAPAPAFEPAGADGLADGLAADRRAPARRPVPPNRQAPLLQPAGDRETADARRRGRVPHGHLDPADKERHGGLVSWLERQRYLNGRHLLDAARVSELDALGMVWSKNANAWEHGHAYTRAWAARHGHLAVPAAEKLDGYAVGAWMRRQRKAENLITDHAAKLDGLDALHRYLQTVTG
uniref:helicase associated domain-containing protein n=1 Tax=Kitasatospora sp. NPDC089797 TaxID=3155298 RepID=UPI00343E48EA